MGSGDKTEQPPQSEEHVAPRFGKKNRFYGTFRIWSRVEFEKDERGFQDIEIDEFLTKIGQSGKKLTLK